VRIPILLIALVFTAGLAVLTAIDIARYGVTVLAVLAILVLALFTFGILGALREPPRE
jgi:hypothetical protein